MDIASGELVWQHEYMPDAISSTPLLYYNGKLFSRTAKGFIYCYDAQSGQILWSNVSVEAIPAPDGRMDAYKDKLYLTASSGGYVYCISISTGELLWKDKGPAEVIQGGIIIDQKTGYLYCHSDWSIMCIDLNKSPKKTVK
jgi:outer membrane protein assembly factor BamB